jgi:hypothetical protein
MGRLYADVSDLTMLGKSLTAPQQEAAALLIESACAKLRVTAAKYGRDLDAMAEDEDFAMAVRSVIVQAVWRALDGMTTPSAAISQGSQTVGSFSMSMTYLNAGQSLYFLRNELKDLGILRQQFGAVELYQSE